MDSECDSEKVDSYSSDSESTDSSSSVQQAIVTTIIDNGYSLFCFIIITMFDMFCSKYELYIHLSMWMCDLQTKNYLL